MRAMRPQRHINKSDLVAIERPPIHPTAIYDTLEAAAVIGIATSTFRRAVDAGEIERLKIGRTLKFTGQHLLNWLKGFEVNETN